MSDQDPMLSAMLKSSGSVGKEINRLITQRPEAILFISIDRRC